jgi:DNA-directed RNA polymerase specialized sigma24 family protein
MGERRNQTGGERRHWSFDPHEVEHIPEIRDALSFTPTYFFDEDEGETTLAKVMDQLLQTLPEDLREAVTLVHIAGRTYRDAGRTLGVDHKTVMSRADRGLKMLKEKLVEVAWITDLLRGYLPADELNEMKRPQGHPVVDVLKTLGGNNEQE